MGAGTRRTARRHPLQGRHPILESFCISWQLIENSAIALLKTDKLVRGPNGTAVHNPHLSILFAREMRSVAAELGLTPAARARLVPVPDLSDDR